MGKRIDLLEYCSKLAAKALTPDLCSDLENNHYRLALNNYTQLLIILTSSFLSEQKKDAQLDCFQALVNQYYSEPVPQSIINTALYIISNKHLVPSSNFTYFGDVKYEIHIPAYAQVKIGEALFSKHYIRTHYSDSLYENELLPNLLYAIDQLWKTIQDNQPLTLHSSPAVPCGDKEKIEDLLSICTKISYKTITLGVGEDASISKAEIKIAELKFKQLLFALVPHLLLISGRWDEREIFEKCCNKYFHEPISLHIIGTAEYVINNLTQTKNDRTNSDYINVDSFAGVEIGETVFPQSYVEYHRGDLFYDNNLLSNLCDAISNLYEAINHRSWISYE